MPECLHLEVIKAGTLGFQAFAEAVCKGKIHVVASKEYVITHCYPLKTELSIFAGDANQAEIRGASSYIADQYKVPRTHFFLPAIPACVEPGIKGRLRFFQECNVIKAC